MSKFAGKGQLKFMIAGTGWATAELLMTRLLPLWVGARGVEFDWKYIQMSLDSNVSLIQHITTAMLVWLHGRNDLRRPLVPVVMALLAISCYRPLLVEIVAHAVGLQSWSLLLANTALTSLLSVITLHMYLCIPSQLSNSHL